MEKEAQATAPEIADTIAAITAEQQELERRYQTRTRHRYGFKQVEGRVVGRDHIIIPEEEVVRLAAIGCRDVEIADWFGIVESTLRYNFADCLTKGRSQLNQSLRRKQIDVALSGNAAMLIWLGKNILGQSDSPLITQDTQPLPWTDL